jgi:hypothetical protein
MNKKYCSKCGEEAYYDGRCGDGHILMCNCDKKPLRKGEETPRPIEFPYDWDKK